MQEKPYRPTLIDEMPSRIWKRVIKAEADIIARRVNIKNLDSILDMNNYKDVINTMLGWVQKCRNIEEAKSMERLSGYISILFALETSFEFVIDANTQIKSHASSSDFLKTFNMPFEGMLINFKYGNKFFSSFISCVEMEEKYHKGNNKYKVYIVKECAVSKENGKWAYGIASEFTFIPELAPRIFVHCRGIEQGCKNYIQANVDRYIQLEYNTDSNVYKAPIDMCIRTPRTIELCPTGQLYSKKMTYDLLSIVESTLNIVRSKRTVQHAIRSKLHNINNEKHERRVSTRQIDRFIDLTQPVKYYGESSGTGTHHSKHRSPRQHLRHEHIRRLKNGKIVYVKETIVNKDKRDKVTYKL